MSKGEASEGAAAESAPAAAEEKAVRRHLREAVPLHVGAQCNKRHGDLAHDNAKEYLLILLKTTINTTSDFTSLPIERVYCLFESLL